MSNQIPVSFVQMYKENIRLLAQQKMSKLRPYVRTEMIKGEYAYFDQIGPVEASPWGPRHGDTPLMETPHYRRRVSTAPWVWADLVDNPDKIRTINDPTNAYTRNAVAAFNRRTDSIIIAGALAPASVGKYGEGEIAFPDSQIVPADFGATGTDTGLTLAKMIYVRERFKALEVDDDEPLVWVTSPRGISDLLSTTEVTSSDYNSVKALVRGEVDTFMGFRFVVTNRLPFANQEQTQRVNLVWVKSGMLLGIGEDIKVRIDERADKKYSTQVYVEMDMGATRMEEEKVMQINVADDPVLPVPIPAPDGPIDPNGEVYP